MTVLFTACATVAPPLPPSLELPKPPTDLRAVRKGDQVTLTWTIPAMTTDRQRARSFGATLICRALAAELTQCGAGIGEVNVPAVAVAQTSSQQPSGSYTDVLREEMQSGDPAAIVSYAVEVKNADGRSAGLSNQVRVPLVRTLPPPQDLRADITSHGIVLTWTEDVVQPGATEQVHYIYRIRRCLEDGTQSIIAGKLPAESEHPFTFTDSNIEWDKTYKYTVQVVTSTATSSVEGRDSPEVKVFAHDTFPPAVPSGLQAVFSGPGQKAFIDLIWAPDSDVDLDGYNVYRHEEGSAPVKINAKAVKTPAYRDGDVESGKHYLYSVSAVDVRGNESARSEEAGESVP